MAADFAQHDDVDLRAIELDVQSESRRQRGRGDRSSPTPAAST